MTEITKERYDIMYTLIEQVMNGTITMKTVVTIIRADTFKKAKQVVMELLEDKFPDKRKYTIIVNNDYAFTYFINDGPYAVDGMLSYKKAKVIG